VYKLKGIKIMDPTIPIINPIIPCLLVWCISGSVLWLLIATLTDIKCSKVGFDLDYKRFKSDYRKYLWFFLCGPVVWVVYLIINISRVFKWLLKWPLLLLDWLLTSIINFFIVYPAEDKNDSEH
jgi:hypothetical protein